MCRVFQLLGDHGTGAVFGLVGYWLWSEAQMTNKAILHKIVRAATVYEDEDDMVRHLAKETECFRRRVARQGTKSYLGLGLFGLV